MAHGVPTCWLEREPVGCESPDRQHLIFTISVSAQFFFFFLKAEAGVFVKAQRTGESPGREQGTGLGPFLVSVKYNTQRLETMPASVFAAHYPEST